MSDTLPSFLVSKICGYLSQDGDQRSLFTSAFVCKAWLPAVRASTPVFQHLHINDNSRFNALATLLLSKACTLQESVHSLWMSSKEDPPIDETLSATVLTLPRLQKVTLNGSKAFSTHWMTNLLSIIGGEVTELYIEQALLGTSKLIDLLLPCPLLEILSLTDVSGGDFLLGSKHPPFPPRRLRSVTLVNAKNAVDDGILTWLAFYHNGIQNMQHLSCTLYSERCSSEVLKFVVAFRLSLNLLELKPTRSGVERAPRVHDFFYRELESEDILRRLVNLERMQMFVPISHLVADEKRRIVSFPIPEREVAVSHIHFVLAHVVKMPRFRELGIFFLVESLQDLQVVEWELIVGNLRRPELTHIQTVILDGFSPNVGEREKIKEWLQDNVTNAMDVVSYGSFAERC